MAMSAGGSGGAIQSTPNVTPMIDVMLVLLIIFMVVIPQMLAGFNAEPPKAVNLKEHPEDEALDHVLGLDAAGNYYLDKKPHLEEDVGPALNAIYGAPGREDFVLFLRAHKDLPYEKVQNAMDIASKNKVVAIGLVAEQQPNTVSTVAGDSKSAAPAPGGKK